MIDNCVTLTCGRVCLLLHYGGVNSGITPLSFSASRHIEHRLIIEPLFEFTEEDSNSLTNHF